MERRASWDRALYILEKKEEKGTLTSDERTLKKVLDKKNSPLFISGFLEDCSDFNILIRKLIEE